LGLITTYIYKKNAVSIITAKKLVSEKVSGIVSLSNEINCRMILINVVKKKW
jgi:hypothetical protein